MSKPSKDIVNRVWSWHEDNPHDRQLVSMLLDGLLVYAKWLRLKREFNGSIKIYETFIEKALQAGFEQDEVVGIQHIGTVFLEKGDLRQAFQWYELALKRTLEPAAQAVCWRRPIAWMLANSGTCRCLCMSASWRYCSSPKIGLI